MHSAMMMAVMRYEVLQPSVVMKLETIGLKTVPPMPLRPRAMPMTMPSLFSNQLASSTLGAREMGMT